MYEIKGIRFEISERTEENIMWSEPEVYKELKKHKIRDDFPTLSYDEVIHIFKPEHPPYGRTIEELLKEKERTDDNIFIIAKLNERDVLGETKTNYILPIGSVKAMCILLNYVLGEGDLPKGIDTMGFENREELQKYVQYEKEE